MLHHVLVIDDEKEVRDVIRLQLSGTRYELLEAEDGEQGIAFLNENALTVDVIICDVRMPKINGVEAVKYFHEQYPSTCESRRGVHEAGRRRVSRQARGKGAARGGGGEGCRQAHVVQR